MKFKVGDLVQWQWLGRPVLGTVKEVFREPVTRIIKGKSIRRNGSKEKPAYIVESEAGNLALKLHTELSERKTTKSGSRKTPTMF